MKVFIIEISTHIWFNIIMFNKVIDKKETFRVTWFTK